MTNMSGPLRAGDTPGAGSGVAEKTRLAEYSPSGVAEGSGLLFERFPFGGRSTRMDLEGDGRFPRNSQERTMEMLAGTSGYSYKEWVGSFYPEKLPAAAMLRHYAERFPTVEINNTFYRMPA